MKKILIYSSIILFTISLVIIACFGKENEVRFDISDMKNITVKYDKKIINCDEVKKDNTLIFKIKPIKKGKTKIIVEGDILDEENKVKRYKTFAKVYVHSFNIITIGGYIGRARGDIFLLISIYLISILGLIMIIKKYINNRKINYYSYENARLLGVILFLFVIISINLIIFGIDSSYGFSASLDSFIWSIQDYIYFFLFIIYPPMFIISILVMISNLILLKKEGKNWRNLLGFFLGNLLFVIIVSITFFRGIIYPKNINSLFINNYFINLAILISSYFECILISTSILSIKAARHIPKFDKDGIIILGCQIKKDGTLTNLLKSRVDRAIEFSKLQKEATGKDIIFIPSGGKGSDEIISEAEAMKNYLLEQGIKEKYILIENKSINTYQNIKFSNKLISEKVKNPKLAFSTTNYHVFRAGIIASNQNIDTEGIGAKTKAYYWINAAIREFIATLVSERKRHIRTIIIMTFILTIVTLFLYIVTII